MAKNSGQDILLLDGGKLSISDILKRTRSFSPDFIGITCWTLEREMVWKLCRALKELIPKVFLAIGGPHATFFPGQIFVKTHASVVVVGEGEQTFNELLSALNKGEELKSIKGLAVRENDNHYFTTPAREPIEDIDQIKFPYYQGFEKFSIKNYQGLPTLPSPTAPVISSRGCVFNCTYCGSVRFWGHKWRYRTPANIIEEMNYLINSLGARSIYFFDDNFPVKKERVFEICNLIIEKNWDIKWACCSHVKMVNEKLLESMKKAGCESIDFGVESGSDRILSRINKKQTCDDIEKAFSLCHKIGIKPRAYLMVGNIGEDTNTIDETIDLFGRIKPYSSLGASILWLLPGTSDYDEAVKKGFISDDFWLKSDEVPYNLQEYSYNELCDLRSRLMHGIAKKKGGVTSRIMCYFKDLFYRYKFLSALRSFVPKKLR